MINAIAPLLLLLAAAPGSETAAESRHQPSATPISWEFEISFLDPRPIEVLLPGQKQPEVFWYMVYTATNTSGRRQQFFPMFQIVTEDLRVINTDMAISPTVFDAIAARHKTTHPYLVPPTKAIGALLAGDDEARESVAIWRQVDLSLNNFSVYIAGLSGETRFVRNPSYDADKPETVTVQADNGREREVTINPPYFALRKTLEVRYTLPGSPRAAYEALPERGEVLWTMR